MSTWDNALDFLTDGARAVHAFSRPYPVATVGVPIDIKFNIEKARFTLKVRVTPDDRSPNRDSQDELKQEVLPTEIFVPLVHFASQSAVDQFMQREVPSEGVYDGPSAYRQSEVSIPTPTSTSSASTLVAQTSLSLDVEVSDGRWEVEGQTLKWWYDVPAEGEVEYSISFQRSNGRIKQDVQPTCWDMLCPLDNGCCLQ